MAKVSDAELATAMAGPAVNTNKFFAANLPNGMRIAFCEAMPEIPPVYRAAVILAYEDAIALRNLLSSQLKDIEPQIAAGEVARRGKTN